MNKALAAVVAIVVVAVGYLFVKPAPEAAPSYGSVTSSQALSNPICVDGSCRYEYLVPMKTATTTVCDIVSPSATTTFSASSISASFLVSSTTATVVTIATSTTGFATTTLLGQFALAANAQGTLIATTTTSDGNVVKPNTHVVFSMAGGVGTFSPAGACAVTFRAVNL